MRPVLALLCVALLALLALSLHLWRRGRARRREAYIRSFSLPAGVFAKLRQRHPHLGLKECQLVAQGLRQFFLAHLKSRRGYVSMPSQVADDLWHEFILCTRNYQSFCRQAFGRFFHHSPAAVLGAARHSNAGLRRCWWQACREENIDPRAATRLPLLFALDEQLAIANGFRYVADCDALRRQDAPGQSGATVYCGGDFGSAGFDGCGGGSADGDGCGDGGDGGGDGGDGGGCGGGCGGGD